MTAAGGKLHVGFVLHSLGGGGAQRVAITLAESLIRRGHRVDMMVGRLLIAYPDSLPAGMRLFYPGLRKSDRELIRRCRERGVAMQALAINPMSMAWDWLALRRRRRGINADIKDAVFAHLVARYVRQERPALLLAGVSRANFAAVDGMELAGFGRPVIASVHSNVSRNYTEYEQRRARDIYPRADAVAAVSEGAGREVEGFLGVPGESVYAIYNPIPSDAIWRQAQEDVGHPWFAAGEPPVVLSVGREAPPKDYATLVEAFGLARRQIRARLVIMGRLSESYRAGLIERAREYGVADDLGFVDFDANPFRYMRRAGLFAFSSRWEGLPTALLEALACGTPAVSTDTPYGPREILADDRWGKLAPVGDAPALAQAMVETLQGDHPPAEALRRRAGEFSEQRAVAAYLALFRKVTGQAS